MGDPYVDRPCPAAKALDLFGGKWKVLKRTGLVVRKDFDENPPHTEYLLSKFGETLLQVFYCFRPLKLR